MNTEYVLGIDFGTTNSVCAILSGGDPEIIENAEGDRVTPSVVYYTKENEQFKPLVGNPAENKAQENPERVLRSIKRDMGESETIEIGNDSYHVEEVGAEIIRKLKRDAAKKLNIDEEELTRAVVTTPAYWESDRNQAVIQAAELAGFESVRTIKEPASAAIAYGRYEPGLDKTVGVYDLGGGTFDFAVVDVDVNNSSGEYNVLAQSGDPELGGDDWDQKIIEWVVSQFMMKHDVNPLNKHHSDANEYDHEIRKERIREAARQAKEDLSNRSKTTVDIRIPFFMTIGDEQVNVEESLTQSRFESMTEELLERTIDPVYTALNDADVPMEKIDDVILVGGSTRMPQVKELVKSVFNTEPKNRVNPDEAVACGAAIKANRDDILLLEVTPLSLGIGINGGEFKRMIDRNERLPARTTEVFTTANEGATAVRIPIYQGERDIASENRHLKTMIIEGMAPGSRSSAHIEVTFEVQQNGLINVQAVENTRNKSVKVELEGENRLPDEYINERVQEAKELEELDRKRQKVIQAQNNAKKSIREAERLLSEFPQVFEGDEGEHMKKHVSNVRQIRRNDTATLGELRDATDALDEWVLEIGDRVRRTGARSRSGPQKGPDVDAAEVSKSDVESGVRGGSPGSIVSNTDSGSQKSESTTDEMVEDWGDTGEIDLGNDKDDVTGFDSGVDAFDDDTDTGVGEESVSDEIEADTGDFSNSDSSESESNEEFIDAGIMEEYDTGEVESGDETESVMGSDSGESDSQSTRRDGVMNISSDGEDLGEINSDWPEGEESGDDTGENKEVTDWEKKSETGGDGSKDVVEGDANGGDTDSSSTEVSETTTGVGQENGVRERSDDSVDSVEDSVENIPSGGVDTSTDITKEENPSGQSNEDITGETSDEGDGDEGESNGTEDVESTDLEDEEKKIQSGEQSTLGDSQIEMR